MLHFCVFKAIVEFHSLASTEAGDAGSACGGLEMPEDGSTTAVSGKGLSCTVQGLKVSEQMLLYSIGTRYTIDSERHALGKISTGCGTRAIGVCNGPCAAWGCRSFVRQFSDKDSEKRRTQETAGNSSRPD